jgi:hypothetical protein
VGDPPVKDSGEQFIHKIPSHVEVRSDAMAS